MVKRVVRSLFLRAFVVMLAVAFCAAAAVPAFASDGTYVTEWGSTGTGNGQFQRPRGIAVDSAGAVYVADRNNNRVQKFTNTGTPSAPNYTFTTAWGGSGLATGQFQNPDGVAVDSAGFIYVTDTANQRVQKFTSAGVYVTSWGVGGNGPGQFNYPEGIAIDSADHVFIAQVIGNRIQEWTNTGTLLTEWGSPGTGPGQFAAPIGLDIDSAGNVYVADSNNNRIQKFRNTGTSSSPTYVYDTEWGGLGSGNGQFNQPYDVGIDSAGIVYVVDYRNNRIQKFTSTGTCVGKWGSYGFGVPGQFTYPVGIALDSADNAFVPDDGAGRVQKFGTASGVWTAQTSGTTSLLTAVSFPTVTDGWAVGSGKILHTSNGGTTWADQAVGQLSGVQFWDVFFWNTSEGWAVGNGGVIYHTSNGGTTWGTQTNPVAQTLVSIQFVSSQEGWASGTNGTVLHTTNGGTTWVQQPRITSATLNCIRFTSATDGWAFGDSGAGVVLHTANGGTSWSTQTSNSSNYLRGGSFGASTVGWAVGKNGQIIKTSNGTTWGAQSSSTALMLNSASFPDATNGWAVGAGGVIVNTADAVNWAQQASGTSRQLWGVDFYDSTHGWAVGDNGTILKYATGGTNTTVASPSTLTFGGGISLTFSGVTAPGTTIITPITATNPPAGFSFLAGQVWDITTSATFATGSGQYIYVTLPYSGTTAPSLWHLEGSPATWVNCTYSTDTVNHTVTGRVTSLSPFAIAEEVAASPITTTSTPASSTWSIVLLVLAGCGVAAIVGSRLGSA